jgi:hypothetical protein
MPPKVTADEPTAGHHPISVGKALCFAWSTFKRRYRFFSAVLLTIFVAWIGLEVVVIAGQRLGILLWTVAHLAFLVFFASLEVGFLQSCLRLCDGEDPKIRNAFAHWSFGLKFLAGQILFLLLVAIGLLLLVLPGVYLGVRYALFGFCMAEGEDLIGSFRQSAVLSSGAWIELFGILGGLLLLNILGASLLGLGLFITLPLSALVVTAIYRQLGARHSQ